MFCLFFFRMDILENCMSVMFATRQHAQSSKSSPPGLLLAILRRGIEQPTQVFKNNLGEKEAAAVALRGFLEQPMPFAPSC